MLRLVLLPVLIELVLGRPGQPTAASPFWPQAAPAPVQSAMPPWAAPWAASVSVGAPVRTPIELAQGLPGAKTAMPPWAASMPVAAANEKTCSRSQNCRCLELQSYGKKLSASVHLLHLATAPRVVAWKVGPCCGFSLASGCGR